MFYYLEFSQETSLSIDTERLARWFADCQIPFQYKHDSGNR